jgi:hypothetical protein
MRPSILLLLFLCLFTSARSQDPWTPAIPLVPGNYDDADPVFVARPTFLPGATGEWIAFSRKHPGETWSNIVVLSSDESGLTWPGPAVAITHDSLTGIDNIHPSLAGIPHPGLAGPENLMLVWEYRLFGSSFIFWSRRADSSWSTAQSIGPEGGSDHTPSVAPVDTTFLMVWERNGRVLFSDFRAGTWDSGVPVSAPWDSLCSHPVIYPLGGPLHPGGALVVWESLKPASADHALWFSFLGEMGWTMPETLTTEGDNRNPQFVRGGWPGHFEVSWESNRSGEWEVFGAGGTLFGGPPVWEDRDVDLTNTPLADEQHAAFQLVPIPVGGGGENFLFHTASVWTMSAAGSDSIALRVFGDPATSYRTGGAGSTDRNPDVSCGQPVQGWMRTWAVWESDATGRWNLYGSRADFSVGVDESGGTEPGRFVLMQNYPNPFNGETTIGYRIRESGSAVQVRLGVYDLLGREVALLVNEPQEPGEHRVRWDSGEMAGGVYFARLQAAGMTQTRRLVLVR